MDLEGRTVLLTGSSGGIGSVAARAIGDAGANLIAHFATDREGAEEATRAIPEHRKLLLAADFAVPGEAERLWATALEWRARIDVLINNAAVMEYGPIDGSADVWAAVWDKAFAVNVRAVADLTRSAVGHFRANAGGVIITMSSWVAQRGPGVPSLMAYAASKAAARSLTQTVARHFGEEDVLAYVIAPGVVRTRLSEIAIDKAGGSGKVMPTLAMGELVPPEELAPLIVFLATGCCRHLSGATLDVNGASYIR